MAGLNGKHIGVLVNTIYSDYSVAYLNGVDRYCAEHDSSYYVFPLEHGKNSGIYDYHCETLLDFITRNNIEGLLVVTATLAYDKNLPRVIHAIKMLPPMPKVSVGFEIEGIASIKIDCTDALKSMVSHLVEKHGAKKFVVIRCAVGNFESDEREAIITKTLSEHGITLEKSQILNGNFLFDNAYSSLSNYLREHGKDMDCVICLNDSMAMGAYQCLCDKGFDVPKDVLVTGFDNIFETGTAELDITTVDQSSVRCNIQLLK